MTVSADELIQKLKASAVPANVGGMAHFGINPQGTLGVSMPAVRQLARGTHDHQAALDLWQSGIHEARILAALVDKPQWVTAGQMEQWVVDFDSWDVCDQVVMNLFDRTPWAVEKAHAWCARPEEFVRRAGFAMIASMAVHDKKAPDAVFLDFLPEIERYSDDSRNFVKKAVNWALRQIGKRNPALNQAALDVCGRLLVSSSPAARWNARDSQKELTSDAVQKKIRAALRPAADGLTLT
jgi:3-methyladenine DNA glycosylase AlkD